MKSCNVPQLPHKIWKIFCESEETFTTYRICFQDSEIFSQRFCKVYKMLTRSQGSSEDFLQDFKKSSISPKTFLPEKCVQDPQELQKILLKFLIQLSF